MHIVVDARMIEASGIGVYLKNILNSLVLKYQVSLIGNPGSLAAFKSNAQIISFDAPIYSIKEQICLPKLIPHCDIFWSPHYNIPVLAIKAKKRVVTIHDVYHLAFSKNLSLSQRLYAKFVIGLATKLSDRVITVSKFSKDEIVNYTGCKKDKITVIYNGVREKGIIKNIEHIAVKYNLPDNYILYIGNVKPHKNLKTLLKSYLMLDANLQQNCKIVIVGKKDGFITGDTGLFTWIEKNNILLNNIVFTGFIDDSDLDTIYNHAKIFVFPSLYEGFGLPPLEAMLNNCPAVVSEASCMPEVCADAALYFNPLNANDIRDKITNVLTDSTIRNELIEKGKLQLRNYSWSKAFDQHVDIFNNIFNKRQ